MTLGERHEAQIFETVFHGGFADAISLRKDHQSILYDHSRLPGLRVFSSAEICFDPETNFFTQFLDLITQYVAKHLIWLRTRRLNRLCNLQLSVHYQPRPGEPVIENSQVVHPVMLPSGPAVAVDYLVWVLARQSR